MIVDNEAKYRTIIIQSLTDCRSFSCDKVCYGFIYRIKDISIIHDHKTINTDKKSIPGFFSCDTYKIAELTNSRRRNKTRNLEKKNHIVRKSQEITKKYLISSISYK